MLTLPTPVRVYLARGATDIRKAINGSTAVMMSVVDQDPLSDHLFVICNRQRDLTKTLQRGRRRESQAAPTLAPRS